MVQYSPAPPQGYDSERAFLISARPPHLQFTISGEGGSGPPPPAGQINWINGANNMINGVNNLVFRKGI